MPTENRSSAEARAVHLTQDREMRVYIAGPMTGLPDFNFPAFNAAAQMMRSAGWHVENSAEHGHVEGAEWGDYLRYDIARLATCEMIMLLPGWSRSEGAKLEVSIARQLGMPIKLAEGAESAQQHQGGPVMRLECEKLWGGDGEYAVDFVKPGWLRECREKGGTFLLYTHADPGEVERLVSANTEFARRHLEGLAEVQQLRAQLAERDALLQRALPYLSNTPDLVQHGAEDLAEEIRSASSGNPCYGPNEWGAECGQCSKCKSASAEPSATGDGVRDERDYAIEHAGYLADAADQVLADYQAYSLAQMLEIEAGDDGDGEHEEAVDSARDDLHEGLANLRSMAYEFRKRRSQAGNVASTDPEPAL